jgi:uncharacterized protein (TIGR03435 family)
MRRVFACVLLLSTVASGQGSPSFEVASIRPSSEQVAQVSAGLRVAGSQVRLTAMSVKEFIVIAYGVKPQQIVGPDWLGQTRFDLAATIPAGGSAVQVPEMLRALLAERFQMTMHRETKEFPVYVLGVAKGGPKIEPSKAPVASAETTGEKPPAVNVTASGSSAGTAVDLGSGSSFAFGNNRLEVRKMTLASFAEVLTRFVDRPVLDQSGLTGNYDVVLNIAPEDYMPLMVRSGVNAGVSLPPQALRLLDGANTDPLSGPLRDVGLTLESRKAPLEIVVVDSISKTPTEN